MAIYESRGFGNSLNLFDKKDPFAYVAESKVKQVPSGVDIAEYKRHSAPYCLSGEVKRDENGRYKRNNASLISRDLIFLDYDELDTSVDLPSLVSKALKDYSYILYPTISHTAEKPRYRLVVKPSHSMNEESYKQTVKEIADKVGLPFDITSLTWSQLQGLPVTTGDPADYVKVVNVARDYPVAINGPNHGPNRQYHAPSSGRKTITMRVLDTLFHGFGSEGGRNVSMTRFVGLLLSKYVNADAPTAYELTKIANSVTDNPLPQQELDRTFESIVKAEIRKRG